MKNSVFAALLIMSAGSTTAIAADFPVKSPASPYVSPWDGWYGSVSAGYIGGNKGAEEQAAWAGDGWLRGDPYWAYTRADNILNSIAGNQDFKSHGALFGLGLGLNKQFGSIVAGFEADVSWTNLQGSRSDDLLYYRIHRDGNSNCEYEVFCSMTSTKSASSLDWLATFRGRLGALAMQNTLFYATGGLAVGGVQASTNISGSFGVRPYPVGEDPAGPDYVQSWNSHASANSVKLGWALGGGVEHKINNSPWSIKAEYLYYDLGSVQIANNIDPTLVGLGRGSNEDGVTKINKFKINGNIIRAGVNYAF